MGVSHFTLFLVKITRRESTRLHYRERWVRCFWTTVSECRAWRFAGNTDCGLLFFCCLWSSGRLDSIKLSFFSTLAPRGFCGASWTRCVFVWFSFTVLFLRKRATVIDFQQFSALWSQCVGDRTTIFVYSVFVYVSRVSGIFTVCRIPEFIPAFHELCFSSVYE